MENRQLKHEEVKTELRKFPITVICENIESPENVGMIFRNCEAMGVERIYFTGTSIVPPNRKIRKISRATDRLVEFKYVKDTRELIANLKAEAYKVWAVEITSASKSLHQACFTNEQKNAFIIGSEKHGVEADTLTQVHGSIEIPLYGSNTSINVVSALTIVLYEVVKQLEINK